MRFVAALVLLIVGLSACAPAESGSTSAPRVSIPTDEQSCRASRGTWRQVCLSGTWSCVVSYADAGKVCRDGNECDGRQCRFASPKVPQDGAPATGKCVATSDPCGCYALVEGGRVTSAICVD